jgi:HSP20 family protein
MATQDRSRQQSSYMPSQGGQQGGGRSDETQGGGEARAQGRMQRGSESQGEERSLATRQGTYMGSNYGSSPFALMRRLTDDMDRIFENFGMGGMFGRSWPFAGARGAFPDSATFWSPDIEMYEDQGKLVVEAELPGMRKEDVEVQLEGDALVVSGERRHESQDRQAGRYMSERSYGTFHRMIRLPEGADAESANASFKDGILRIEMPLNQRARGRRLEIGDGGTTHEQSPTGRQASQGGGTQGASNSAQPNARGDDGAPTG